MFMILRTLFGLVVGWIASAVFALLGRHNQGSLAVRPDRRQFLHRELSVHEQPHLLEVVGAHVLAQRLPHRMRAGLRHRDEHEAVLVGNDHPAILRKMRPKRPWTTGRAGLAQGSAARREAVGRG